MANNKYENLFKWIQSVEGKELLENYTKYGLSDSYVLDQWKQTGQDVHNIQTALARYQQAVGKLGYERVNVETDGNGVTITFLPTNSRVKLKPEECPSITIGKAKDGIVIENGMPAINNPIGVRGANGQYGVSNAIAIGIDEAAENLQRILKAQKDFKSYTVKELTQKIKEATNGGMNAARELNPKVWSPSASKEFKESIQIKNAMNAPIEYMVAKQRQMQMNYYSNALYKALEQQDKLWGEGAPSTQKQFESMVQNVFNAARGSKNFASLDKQIKELMPSWFYQNAWKGEMENIFSTLGKNKGLKLNQGGKREGAPGILGIGEDIDLPFHQLQITGRKLEQNLMHYVKEAGKSSSAIGTSKLVTEGLTSLYKNYYGKGKKGEGNPEWAKKLKRDIYGYAQIEDKDLIVGVQQWARQQLGMKDYKNISDEKGFKEAFEKAPKNIKDLIKKQYKIFGSKGFGKDASISSWSMREDFKDIEQADLKNDIIDVTEAINEIAKKTVYNTERNRAKKNKENFSKEDFNRDIAKYSKEIEKIRKQILEDDKNSLLKKQLGKILGLDSRTKIREYKISKSKNDIGEEIFSASGIVTAKKVFGSTGVLRGAYTADERTNKTDTGSEIGDQILGLALISAGYDKTEVYKDGDPNKGLAITYVDQKEKINEKNFRSQLNSTIEYILNKADADDKGQKLQDKLKKLTDESVLKGVFIWDNTTGFVSINSQALEANLKKSKKLKEGPLALFNEITDLGRELKYLLPGSGLKFDVDEKGEVTQTGRMIGARAIELAAVDDFTGAGAETHSKAGIGSHELMSLAGSIGEMRERGQEDAANGMQKIYRAIKRKMDKQKLVYSKYTKSVEAIQQYGFRGDRDKVIDASNSESSDLVLIGLQELAGLNLELSERTATGGIQYNKEDENPFTFLEKKKKDRYKQLIGPNGENKEALQKRGIFSPKDIQIGLDLGQYVHGRRNGKDLFTSVAMLGYGVSEKSKQENSWMPDDVMKENIGLMRAAWNFYGTPDKTGKTSDALFREIYDRYHNIDDAVQGSIYDKYDTVSGGKDSGWVLLSAMNNYAQELFGNGTVFGEKGFKAPDMILSATTAKAMFNSEWETKSGRKAILEEYQKLFPEGKAKKKRDIIQAIIDKYDISKSSYNGDFYKGLLFNRFPTIRFAGDFFNGNLAFASGNQFTRQGGLIINQDLAGLGKGDMDGDKIAFFNAIQLAGSTPEERLTPEEMQAIINYNQTNASTAKILREEEDLKTSQEKLDVKKIFSLVNDKDIRKRLSLINTSAPGAGIYGDEVYAVASILSERALGQESAPLRPVDSFLANFALKTVASLYQEGINIKNSKGKAGEAEILSMLKMSGQGRTWDNYEQMLSFLSKAENAGIFKEKAAFKKEIIEQLNLPNLNPTDPKIKRLEDLAKKYRIKWSPSENNIPTKLLAAILTDEEIGVRSLFRDGQSLGQLIENRYYTLAHHRGILKYDNYKNIIPSEEVLKDLGLSSEKIESLQREERISDIVKEVNSKNAIISDFHTSATGKNGIEKTLAPFITGKEQNDYTTYIKMIDSDKKISDQDLAEINKLSPDYKEGLASMVGTLVGGTISHKIAEAEITKNKRKQKSLQKEAESYYNIRKENVMKALGIPEEKFDDFVNNGKDLGDLVSYTLEQNKGKLIGTELSVSGFVKGNNNAYVQGKGFMDYVYSHKNEYGKNILTVGDFKTNSTGKPSIENVIQSLTYQQWLRQLQQDILQSGSFTAEDYIGSNRNFANKWVEMFGSDSLKKIYADVKGAEGFEGELSIKDSNGLITKHSINSTSQAARKLISRIFGTSEEKGELTKEEQEGILSNTSIIGKTGSYVGSATDPFSLFGEEANELRKLSKNQKILELKRAKLAALKEINRTELPSKQKDETVFEEQDRLLTTQIEKNKEDLEKAQEDLLAKGKITLLDGSKRELTKEYLEDMVYSKSYDEEKLKEAEIQEMKNSAAKRQYKEYLREEKRRKTELIDLQTSLDLGNKTGISESDKRDISEEISNINDYLKVINLLKAGAEKTIKGLKGGNQFLKNYKPEDEKYWDDKKTESYIKQSLQLRSEENRMYSMGQSSWQKVNSIQRQINGYDKSLNDKNTSEAEKNIIQQLKAKSLEDLKRAQDNAKLYDDLYGEKGIQPSADYQAGKKTALDYDKIQKEREALNEKERKDQQWMINTGFLGIDRPMMNWMNRMLTGGGIYTAIRKISKAMTNIVNKAAQLDKAVTNLRMVTGDDAETTRTLVDTYSDLAKQLGVTTTEVANSASEWMRQGYSASEAQDLVQSSIYLSKLGLIDMTTATKDLTSALKGFKLESTDAMDVVDKLTALDVEAATTAGDIAEGLAQFANLATLNGVDINQAAAYVATIADVTQQSGNSVGNAMKTIMSRFGNVKASAYNELNLEDTGSASSEDLNDVEKVLSKLGISIRDGNLQFKDFDEILDEIADKWGNLDNVSKKAIANAFAGTRQQESFLTLLENYDSYKDYLKTSQNSSGTAETKYQTYKESYEAAKNSLTASIESIANDSSIINLMKDLTNRLTGIIDLLKPLVKYLPGFLTQVNSIRGMYGKGIVQQGYNAWARYSKFRKKHGGYGIAEGWERVHGQSFKQSMQPFEKGAQVTGKYLGTAARFIPNKISKQVQKIRLKRQTKSYNDAKFFNDQTDTDMRITGQTLNNIDDKDQYLKNQELIKKFEERRQRIEEEAVKEAAKKAEKAAKKASKQPAQSTVASNAAQQSNQSVNQQPSQSNGTNIVVQQPGQVAGQQPTQSGKKTATGGAKLQTGLMVANMVVSGVTNSLASLSTQGTTHKTRKYNASKGKYEEVEVESSEEAQKVAGQAAAATNLFSGIPIIGGAISLGATKLAETITAEIDKYRDQAAALTEEATAKLSALSTINSSLNSIGEDVGSIASQNSVSELMKTLYSSEGNETREILAQYLGGESELYSVLNRIKEGDEDAYRELQLAQIQAESDQIYASHATEMYNNNQDITSAYNKMEDYDGSNGGERAGIMIGTGYAGLNLGAGVGTGIGALIGSFIAPGIGTAVGALIGAAIGGVAGAGAGTWGGSLIEDSLEEKRRQAHAREADLLTKSYGEQMEILNTSIEDFEEEIANTTDLTDDNKKSLEKEIETRKDLIEALTKQHVLASEIQEEKNEKTTEAAMVGAAVGEGDDKKYLSDMTTSELKNLGVTQILTAYAKEIENQGGLLGEEIWADPKTKTTLSEAGYDLVMKYLKKQDDSEINSVLTGESYTLNEILALRDKFGDNDTFVKRQMQNFATALGMTTDQLLDETTQKMYGVLTYAETILSASDLSEKVDTYTGLLSDITEGAGDVSAWMETIISQFPELIQYLGNSSTLFDAIVGKLSALQKAYLNSEYADIAGSQEYFKSLQDTDEYKGLSDAQKDMINASGVTTLTGLSQWLANQTETEDTKTIASVFSSITEGTTISSTAALKAQMEKVISYKTSLLEDEINNLNEQKEALQSITSEREYENKLIEAKLKLENASKEKKRVYRAGVGWTYESDQASIKEAQENLETVQNEKTISSLEAQIADLQQEKDAYENIYEKANNEELKKFSESFTKQFADGSLLDNIKTVAEGIKTTVSDMFENSIKTNKDNLADKYQTVSDAWEALKNSEPGTSAFNTALQSYHTAVDDYKSAGGKTSDLENLEGSVNLNTGRDDETAKAIAEGTYSEQRTNVPLKIVLASGDSSKRYVGSTSLDNMGLDDTTKGYIWKDLKNGKAYLWKTDGSKQSSTHYKDSDENLEDYIQRLGTEYNITEGILSGYDGENEAVYFNGSLLYEITNNTGKNKHGLTLQEASKAGNLGMYEEEAATGSLGLEGVGSTLINELGTEAIITPQGTITALPSHTGIVPADITKNLWELGEVAPAITRTLIGNIIPDTLQHNSMSTTNDESLNVGTLNISMNADGSFDVDSFVSALRSRVALTRNSSK